MNNQQNKTTDNSSKNNSKVDDAKVNALREQTKAKTDQTVNKDGKDTNTKVRNES